METPQRAAQNGDPPLAPPPSRDTGTRPVSGLPRSHIPNAAPKLRSPRPAASPPGAPTRTQDALRSRSKHPPAPPGRGRPRGITGRRRGRAGSRRRGRGRGLRADARAPGRGATGTLVARGAGVAAGARAGSELSRHLGRQVPAAAARAARAHGPSPCTPSWCATRTAASTPRSRGCCSPPATGRG